MRKTQDGLVIAVTREDLLLFRKHLAVRHIDLNCFSRRAASREEIELAARIVFRDDDGQVTILKDRGIKPSLNFDTLADIK